MIFRDHLNANRSSNNHNLAYRRVGKSLIEAGLVHISRSTHHLPYSHNDLICRAQDMGNYPRSMIR